MAKTKVPDRQAQRAELLATMRRARKKLDRGAPLTEREARILKRGYDSFMELYNVFRPTIKETLMQLGNSIEDSLDAATIIEEDD